jgi:uncharacterized protein YbjT (DUF2867 family)
MKVLLAGSHGKVGQILVKKLVEKGHEVKAMIRDKDQKDEMKKLGAEPVISDLEKDTEFPLEHIDVVMFAAGSGPDTSDEKTVAVDQKGAIKLIEAAYRSKVQRFVMLSSVGAHDPNAGPDKMHTYLKAKHEADKELKFSSLLYTVIRPVQLTDDKGTGKVCAAIELENRKAKIPREDVAEVMAACLDHAHTENKVFELSSGSTPIHEALVNLPLSQ